MDSNNMMYQQPEPHVRQSGLGIAGMIIGIISLLTACIVLGGFLGIIGLILSIIGIVQKDKKSGMAVTGIVLNIIAIVIMIIMLVVISGENTTVDNSQNSIESQSVANEVSTVQDDIPIEDVSTEPAPVETTPAETTPAVVESTDEQVVDAGIIDIDISNCHVKYLSHELVTNLSNEECLAVYYEFTNNSNENKSFSYTVTDTAFQNGIEAESSFYHVNDESKYRSSEIQPGTTVTVCTGFVLRDHSDVELEIEPLFNLSGQPSASMIITIE